MLTRSHALPAASEPIDREAPVSIRGLSVAYQDLPVVDDVSLDIVPGSMTAIVGPNGAGKSTLLKSALGLVPARSGRVAFFGEPFQRVRRRVAFVPQRAAVDWDFPATAVDVVLMGLYAELGPLRFAGSRHRSRARAALDRVGLADLADRQIGRLSGGQQQRVFLARALAQDAELTLLDEPFAGVDAATEQAIVAVLKSLNDAGPTAVVFTEAALAATYGGRLAATTGIAFAGARP